MDIAPIVAQVALGFLLLALVIALLLARRP